MDSRENESSNSEPWKSGLYYACLRFLRNVLWGQGAASTDLVETVARQLAKEAEFHAQWAQEQRGDWKIVERAIDYLSNVHDGPWRGVEWFKQSLDLVIELAVPNTGLDALAASFLLDVQMGIGQSYQSSPVERSSLRLTDEAAKEVKTLVQAGCQYGLVSDLLDLGERIFHGEPLSEDDQSLLHVAAIAASLTRIERGD
ncbi:MAG TPA: hypothetical protein VJ654_18545 [Noviherbaspirillum sp.]|nr:hypothetical protein [Noviherbaspirillum sp.]